jgi:hypothetical protein
LPELSGTPLPLESNVLLLESVALNLNALNGDPVIPVVEVLTVILDIVLEIRVGALGVPGGPPAALVVIEVPGPVVLPNVLNKVTVTVYALDEFNPLIVPL